jgi:hypothetical protein
MRIETYVQGADAGADRELFGTLGALLTDRRFHEAMGMAVTSEAGDVWMLAMDGDELLGFATVHPLKSKSAHLKFVHGAPGVQQSLLEAVLGWAGGERFVGIHTNDRRTAEIWPLNGFTPKIGNRRGEFVRWEREIKETANV